MKKKIIKALKYFFIFMHFTFMTFMIALTLVSAARGFYHIVIGTYADILEWISVGAVVIVGGTAGLGWFIIDGEE